MRLRRWLTVLIAVAGVAGAMPEDGGAAGGGALTAEERAGLMARVDAAQARAVLARHLTELHAAVARFADVEEAVHAGYEPAGPCMAHARGGQGIHYGSPSMMAEPVVDAHVPQLLMYEPQSDGSLRFVGVEYLVFRQAWHDAGNEGRPHLFGQTFGLNETLLDEPFYLLHVWIGQFNPGGTFADWNPLVACGAAASTRTGGDGL
jgi:hypothetical protein